MQIFLIIVAVMVYLGGLLTIIFTYEYLPPNSWVLIFLVMCLNILSARYLYLKSAHKKTEWMLFGLIGNIYALLAFWIGSFILRRAKKTF